MIFKLLKAMVKWPLVTASIVGLTYTYHTQLNTIVNAVRYYGIKAEEGFIDKHRASRLEIHSQINEEGNLESYVLSNDNALPIYKRRKAIMVGTAEYNYMNFTDKERSYLCSGNNPKRADAKKVKIRKTNAGTLFSEAYELFSN